MYRFLVAFLLCRTGFFAFLVSMHCRLARSLCLLFVVHIGYVFCVCNTKVTFYEYYVYALRWKRKAHEYCFIVWFISIFFSFATNGDRLRKCIVRVCVCVCVCFHINLKRPSFILFSVPFIFMSIVYFYFYLFYSLFYFNTFTLQWSYLFCASLCCDV